jgi:hypothetical protein
MDPTECLNPAARLDTGPVRLLGATVRAPLGTSRARLRQRRRISTVGAGGRRSWRSFAAVRSARAGTALASSRHSPSAQCAWIVGLDGGRHARCYLVDLAYRLPGPEPPIISGTVLGSGGVVRYRLVTATARRGRDRHDGGGNTCTAAVRACTTITLLLRPASAHGGNGIVIMTASWAEIGRRSTAIR